MTKSSIFLKNYSSSKRLVILLIICILIGVSFRFINLSKKIYWHDEVYTSLRSAGFQSKDFWQEISNNSIISANTLQKYQQIKPGSSQKDVIQSLAKQEPQHPPLYFLLARLWMKNFGYEPGVMRLLSVILSLIGIPFMYLLTYQLFSSQITALIATGLWSLSPLNIALAQGSRQYAFFSVLVVSSSYFLLKAKKRSSFINWLIYSVNCGIGLYTQPLFLLTIISHGLYIFINWFRINLKLEYQAHKHTFFNLPAKFILAVAGAILLYLPWLIVISKNRETVEKTTGWLLRKIEFYSIIKTWIVNFNSLIIDLNIYPHNRSNTSFYQLLFFLIIIWSLYIVWQKSNFSQKTFIFISIFLPFVILLIPDLLFGGMRSTVDRYLVPCFPSVQLAIAYCLSRHLMQKNQYKIGKLLLVTIISSCMISNIIIVFHSTSLARSTYFNYSNYSYSQILNQEKSPLVIVSRNSTWIGNLISLSYLLDDNVHFLSLNNEEKNLILIEKVKNEYNIFLFEPSKEIIELMKRENFTIEAIFPQGKLYRVKNRPLTKI